MFCLGWWSTLLPTRFLVSRGTLDTSPLAFLSPTRVSLSAPLLPRSFGLKGFDFCRSSTPDVRRCPVWALPCSLAATWGISFDYFSSGYLDVSVRRVCLPCHTWMIRHDSYRVALFGDSWIKAYLRLPMTFRSLSRPSSARSAQASAVCPL